MSNITATQETKRPYVRAIITGTPGFGSEIARAISDTFINSSGEYDLEVEQTFPESEISDGYHTFNELYEHRHALFMAMVASHANDAWMSALHHDGSKMDGWFIAGLTCAQEDLDADGDIIYRHISYHLPMSYWVDVQRLGVHVLEHAPEWDGHTSQDVIVRLKSFANVVADYHRDNDSDVTDVSVSTIYTDHNGLAVIAMSGPDERVEGRDMSGHVYNVGPTADGYQLVQFQQGPVPANGVNGVTNETLLAILIDRTAKLNEQFHCHENDVAIEHMRAALRSLEDRTAKRQQRGVEGVEVA